MKTPTFLVALLLLSVTLIAQDAPMPQDIPLQQPKRRFENPLDIQENIIRSFKARIDDPQRTSADDTNAKQRIQALELKVKNLEAEVAAQRALINALQERLDRLQNKN
jgi:predicted RNase H-like nuclease (RuvC/YqgF family)